MELYLYATRGMKGHSKELLKAWQGGTLVLCPRGLDRKGMRDYANIAGSNQAAILIDPEHYVPRADHERLTNHEFWPDDYETSTFGSKNLGPMLADLVELNEELETSRMILPGRYAQQVDQAYLELLENTWEVARGLVEKPLLITLCLSPGIVRDSRQVDKLVSFLETAPVSGFYVAFETPKNLMITNDPIWLANSLDLVAGLTRSGYKVIVGHANQQQLIMACAGAEALVTGMYPNTRKFTKDKYYDNYLADFQPPKEGPTVYYYCPQALSDFPIQFVDIAVAKGLRNTLIADPATPYSQSLFRVPVPSSSGWDTTMSRRHYMMALAQQAANLAHATYDETINEYARLLESVEATFANIDAVSISTARGADYSATVGPTRDALSLLHNVHGPILRREWNVITG